MPLRQRHKNKGKKEECAQAAAESIKESYSPSYFYVDIVFIIIACMTVYINTLYPSIAGGDSGELVAESCHLGVSHPPGYPLFNMIVYAVTRVPIHTKSYAWKANAFAAACDTVCAVFIYLSIMLWTKRTSLSNRPSAITASLLFAFSPLIWTYAIGAEVFSLNNMLTGALLYSLLVYADSGKWSHACLGAFVSGLAMCNQHTIILFEIPIILWVLWTLRKVLSGHRLLVLGSFFLLGLLPYLYMPITSYLNAQPGSWGHVITLSGFFHHLRRGDYGTFKLFSTNKVTEDLQTRLRFYVRDLVSKEGMYIIAPLALYGIFVMLTKKQFGVQSSWSDKSKKKELKLVREVNTASVGYLIVLTYIFYMLVFHSLSNLPLGEGLLYGVHMRFWQQPNIIVFIWMGIGLSAFITMLSESVSGRNVIGAVLGIGLTASQIYRWHRICDQSDGWYINNYAKALIDPLPKNALFFTNYDLQWTALRYLQRCEGFRTDVTLLNLSMMTYKWFRHKHVHYPELMFPGSHLVPSGSTSGGFSMKQLVDANFQSFKKKGIYIGGKLSFPDRDFSATYESVPFGLLNRFALVSKPPSIDKYYWKNNRAMAIVQRYLPKLPPPDIYGDETWEWTVARDYHMHEVEQATYLLQKVIAKNSSLMLLVEAAQPLEYTLMNEPKEFYADHLLKNLGLAYAYMVKSTEQFDLHEGDPEPFESYVGESVANQTNYKDRATDRMLQVWRDWIETPTASQDDAFETIKGIVAKINGK